MTRFNWLMIVLAFAWNASAETPTELLDRFEAKASQVKSWERTTKTTSDAEGVHFVTTSVERAIRIDGVLKTFTEEEEVISSKDGIVATVKKRVYSDGKVKWTETLDASGKPVKVEKSPAPKSFFENTRKHLSKLEVTLKPNETLDGSDHAVMTFAHKALGLTTTVWFNAQTGFESKKVVTDDAGSTTRVVTSIKLNADLRPEQFIYTPPTGVPVEDNDG